eukprot:CAMPEP_0182830418 /NCGR_PEP_ID=MMETSP0006_2-20121128/18565_1 /TAXON_ID=97485 /ORGANISM="Prymnesium parvum, Strain Texoma1" /LENGTH=114 /DNA_ID=CAMNT_0024957985 /DNA_START=692 /DNA_END=1037 /DNA_ORIENTATION=-
MTGAVWLRDARVIFDLEFRLREATPASTSAFSATFAAASFAALTATLSGILQQRQFDFGYLRPHCPDEDGFQHLGVEWRRTCSAVATAFDEADFGEQLVQLFLHLCDRLEGAPS